MVIVACKDNTQWMKTFCWENMDNNHMDNQFLVRHDVFNSL